MRRWRDGHRSPAPTLKQNELLVRRGIEEEYNQGNLAVVVDEHAASDVVIHLPSEEIQWPEAAKEDIAALRASFPDFHLLIEDQVAEGTGSWRWAASPTAGSWSAG